jgi:hypothetical protein
MNMNSFLQKENETLLVMTLIYCRAVHGTKSGLCADCSAVVEYADQKINKCPWGKKKPVCTHCPIHCFELDMRQRIRKIMRFSGPRMLLRHPITTLFHIGRKIFVRKSLSHLKIRAADKGASSLSN